MEERNQRPEEGSKLPSIALAVLIFIIFALLYVGYEYFADQTSSTSELTNVKSDTTMTASREPDGDLQPTEAQATPTDNAPPANVPGDEVATAEDGTDEEEKKATPAAVGKKPEAPKAETPKPTP
ncbi:MAG: peptidoglycan-binding protein, partial [Cytophagaceae bacterium]|nr:peptidoglycan-binding protein [Cytophagaceae bacterium]